MRLNQNLRSAKWIYAKGVLFLLLALIAASLLLYRAPQWNVLVLLTICVWASCRAYYFAFYVIQHYVDTNYRFSGLMNFASYVISGKVSIPNPNGDQPTTTKDD